MEEDKAVVLKALRNEMARLTLKIIRLSGKRAAIAKRIGEIKAQSNMPIEDPDVERELRNRIVDESIKHGINIDFSLRLLDLLLEESKRIQREILKSKTQTYPLEG